MGRPAPRATVPDGPSAAMRIMRTTTRTSPPHPRTAPITALMILLALTAASCTAGDDEDPGPTPTPTSSAERQYDEPWRPQVHYSDPEGRLADPNGLVFVDGEWHLFHQQDGTWAHAVSTDLMHWQPLPVALEHDELGQALTGSIVVDGANTSGLFPDGDGGLVATYTSTEGGEAQSIAFSTDQGRTWQRYDDNPVIDNDGRRDFRDPKVFWHEATRSWVMVVSAGDAVEIFRSPDLRTWSFASRFGDGQGLHAAVWECPDLFPLRVDDDPDRVQWVLHTSVGANDQTDGSTAQYFVGQFDGTTFTRDPEVPPETWQQTDAGQDFYAAQSFESAPDGRRVWLAWMGNWRYPYGTPTTPWTNAMSLPRDLGLRSVDGQVRLVQVPSPELESLRGEPVAHPAGELDGDLALDLPGEVYETAVAIDVEDADEVGLRVHERRDDEGRVVEAVTVGIRPGELVVDRTLGGLDRVQDASGQDVDFRARRAVPYSPVDGIVRLRVVVDRSSVEVFVDDGTLVATLLSFPSEGADGASLYALGGTARVESATTWALASVW